MCVCVCVRVRLYTSYKMCTNMQLAWTASVPIPKLRRMHGYEEVERGKEYKGKKRKEKKVTREVEDGEETIPCIVQSSIRLAFP